MTLLRSSYRNTCMSRQSSQTTSSHPGEMLDPRGHVAKCRHFWLSPQQGGGGVLLASGGQRPQMLHRTPPPTQVSSPRCQEGKSLDTAQNLYNVPHILLPYRVCPSLGRENSAGSLSGKGDIKILHRWIPEDLFPKLFHQKENFASNPSTLGRRSQPVGRYWQSEFHLQTRGLILFLGLNMLHTISLRH